MSYTESVNADVLAMHERSGPGFLNRLLHRDLEKNGNHGLEPTMVHQ